jgi:hypothetical protein
VLLRCVRGEEFECKANAACCFFASHPTALGGDTERGETKAGGGDACDRTIQRASFRSIVMSSVFYQAGMRICVIQKIAKGAPREIFEEWLVQFFRRRFCFWRGGWRRSLPGFLGLRARRRSEPGRRQQ